MLIRNLQELNQEHFKNFVVSVQRSEDSDVKSLFRNEGVESEGLDHTGLLSVFPTLVRLNKLIQQNKIDLIHIQGTPLDKRYGQIAAMWSRLPVVRTLHGVRADSVPSQRIGASILHPKRILRKVLGSIGSLFDRNLDRAVVQHFIAVSDDVYNSWSPYLESLRIPAERISVSYNGVPLEQFEERSNNRELLSLRGELDLTGVYPVLINVGTLSKRKGQDILIPTIARLLHNWPKARLLLVGEGPERENLEETIRCRGLERHIQLLGQRTNIPELLALSDVFVFSTTGAFEGCPLSVLEALAAGKPVVSFIFPASSHVLKDGQTGYIVEERSPEALAETIDTVVRDRNKLALMGAEARRVVREQFSIRSSVKRLEAVYLRSLEGTLGN